MSLSTQHSIVEGTRSFSSDTGALTHQLTRRSGRVPYSFCSSVSLSENWGWIYRLTYAANISTQHMSGSHHVLNKRRSLLLRKLRGAGSTLQTRLSCIFLCSICLLLGHSLFQSQPWLTWEGGIDPFFHFHEFSPSFWLWHRFCSPWDSAFNRKLNSGRVTEWL